jgi:hypothetical protein
VYDLQTKEWRWLSSGLWLAPVILNVSAGVLSMPEQVPGNAVIRRHDIFLGSLSDAWVQLKAPFRWSDVCVEDGGEEHDAICRKKELEALFTNAPNGELNYP